MNIFCDNKSVMKNSTMIESTLNKKHNLVAYHYVRWHDAAGILKLSWISMEVNLADAMTKQLTEWKRNILFGTWTVFVIVVTIQM